MRGQIRPHSYRFQFRYACDREARAVVSSIIATHAEGMALAGGCRGVQGGPPLRSSRHRPHVGGRFDVDAAAIDRKLIDALGTCPYLDSAPEDGHSDTNRDKDLVKTITQAPNP